MRLRERRALPSARPTRSRLWTTKTHRLPRLIVLGLLMAAGTAAAQDEEAKIPRFAVDVHGSLPRFKQIPGLVAPYHLQPTDLPTRGLGFDVGGHVYLVTWRWITFGAGGSTLLSRGHSGTRKVNGTVVGKDVTLTFKALSPQMSFNFGKGDGWSYLSGGLGWSWVAITTPAAPVDVTTRRKTINYGGGARWFTSDHMAFNIDIRFYAINPQAATDLLKQAPRMTLVVLSAGISFK
jgi:hypothetical protein